MAHSKFRNGKWIGEEPSDKLDLTKPFGGALHTFHEGWYEHVGDDPIYIDSMSKLKEECDKRGETSAYERDTSYFNRSRRWI